MCWGRIYNNLVKKKKNTEQQNEEKNTIIMQQTQNVGISWVSQQNETFEVAALK